MEEFDDLLKEPDESGYLDLSHRAWSTLDDVLWTWGQQLIVLNVSFNNVKTISEGIGELVLLREFDISCNSLEELPSMGFLSLGYTDIRDHIPCTRFYSNVGICYHKLH